MEGSTLALQDEVVLVALVAVVLVPLAVLRILADHRRVDPPLDGADLVPEKEILHIPVDCTSSSEPLEITDRPSSKGQGALLRGILRPDRRLVEVSKSNRIVSDDPAIVTERLGIRLQKSAMYLATYCRNLVTGTIVGYEGQGSILRSPDGRHLKFSTAKHNLESGPNEYGEFEVCKWHVPVLPEHIKGGGGHQAPITFPETGWTKTNNTLIHLRDGAASASGLDISFGPSADARSILHDSDFTPLDVVKNSFVYRVGMKVAVLVYKFGGSIEINVPGFDDQTKIPFYVGRPKDTLVLTGTITHVGKLHIEYDVNTFPGCSGSAVILLEEGHPDFLKAIAVVAGHMTYRTGMKTNIGFKLTGMRWGENRGGCIGALKSFFCPQRKA